MVDENVKTVLVDAKATVYLPIFAKKHVIFDMLLSDDDSILQKVRINVFICIYDKSTFSFIFVKALMK